MKSGTITLSFLFIFIVASAMSAAVPVKKTASKSEARKKAPEKTLLFFMNPNGGPCQRQLSILDGIADSLAPLARIVYVKTTNNEDISKFREYGIRGLPSLIITDTTGKERHRFSPGIQPAESILKALKK